MPIQCPLCKSYDLTTYFAEEVPCSVTGSLGNDRQEAIQDQDPDLAYSDPVRVLCRSCDTKFGVEAKNGMLTRLFAPGEFGHDDNTEASRVSLLLGLFDDAFAIAVGDRVAVVMGKTCVAHCRREVYDHYRVAKSELNLPDLDPPPVAQITHPLTGHVGAVYADTETQEAPPA